MPTYFIHDNGGRPFKVVIDAKVKSLEVFKIDEKAYDAYIEKTYHPKKNECVSDDDDVKYYTKSVLKIPKYKKIFIGEDWVEKEFKGNSILVNIIDMTYVFIGCIIYSFQTEEKINEYKSPVGNSDVPYPYAVGKKYVYFMIENQYADKSEFVNYDGIIFDDPYHKFYGFQFSLDKKGKSKFELWKKEHVYNIKHKTLVKRL